MKEFNFKERKNVLVLKICGKDYRFDVSPTNYKFVKAISAIWREVEDLTKKFANSKNEDLGTIEAQFDAIKAKEQEMVELLIPGAWDELFEKAGNDLLDMVDLLTFIASNIKGAGVAAKVDSVKPATKGSREI